MTQSHADIQAAQTPPIDRTMKPDSIKIQLATSLMLFLAVIDQRCALLIYPQGLGRTDPQRVPRRSCRLITANMQNVLLNNEYVWQRARLPRATFVAIKVRLTLQRAWTIRYISGRACRRERGWQMCYIMREEAGRCATCQDTDVCVSLTSLPVIRFNPQV